MSKYSIKRHSKLLGKRLCIAVELERDAAHLDHGKVTMIPAPILLWENNGIGNYATGEGRTGREWFETSSLALVVWFLFWSASFSIEVLKRKAS